MQDIAAGHVRVDVLYDRFSPRKKAIIDIAGTVLFLLPLSLLIIEGSVWYVQEAYTSGEISGDPGGLPHRLDRVDLVGQERNGVVLAEHGVGSQEGHLLALVPVREARSQVLIGLLFGDKVSTEKFHLGLNVGVNISDLSGVDGTKSRTGFMLGLLGEWRFADRWYLQPEMAFVYVTAIITVMLFWRHRSNIRNLLSGAEGKIAHKPSSGPDDGS